MKTRQAQPKQGNLEIELKPGAHAALLYTDSGVPEAALHFLAEGVRKGENTAFLGYGRLSERVVAQLRDLQSVDVRAAMADGTLSVLSAREDAKAFRADLAKTFGRGGRRRPAGRLVTSLGWGEVGWPDENELLQLDSRLNEWAEELNFSALCLYDARQMEGSLLFHGGFECHPTVITRCTAHSNPFFVEQATLQKELGARRRDESRLQAWMS